MMPSPSRPSAMFSLGRLTGQALRRPIYSLWVIIQILAGSLTGLLVLAVGFALIIGGIVAFAFILKLTMLALTMNGESNAWPYID